MWLPTKSRSTMPFEFQCKMLGYIISANQCSVEENILYEWTLSKCNTHLRSQFNNTQSDAFVLYLGWVPFVLQSEQDREVFGSRVYPNDTSLAVPVGEMKGRLVMDANPVIYSSTRPANFSRYFEVNASVLSWQCRGCEVWFSSGET